jgi:hypothetical protein
MLFLPFQNVASVHQIAPNRMQVFKKIFPGVIPPDPLQLGALPPDPREGKGREGKGKKREGKGEGKGREREEGRGKGSYGMGRDGV